MENPSTTCNTNYKLEETDLMNKTYVSSNHNSLKNNTSETKICLFFMKNRYCSYGRNCRFLHDKQSFKQDERNPSVKFKTKIFVRKEDENTNSKSHWKERHKSIPNEIPENKRKICRYFKAGNCDKGENCLFQHTFDDKSVPNFNVNGSNKAKRKKRVPICHYFKKGACGRGESCMFYHQIKLENAKQEIPDNCKITESDPDENVRELKKDQTFETNKDLINIKDNSPSRQNCLSTHTDSSINKIPQLPRVIDIPRNKMLNLVSLVEEDLRNLRGTEIMQLKKRYPRHTAAEETESISFTFEPSDPDWPFDLKTLELEVFFPEKYPVEPFSVSVLRPTSNIPEMLIRYLNRSIIDWVNKRHQDLLTSNQVELMFRPFLKWFDKSLEDLFITGLRKVKLDLDAQKDGIEFVPVETLFQGKDQNKDSYESAENENATTVTTNEIASESKDEDKKHPPVTSSRNNTSFDTTALKQGVKVLFTGLELVEGVATLSCTKLSMTTLCIRCKTPSNMLCIPGKNNTAKCTKCSKVIECNFAPSILHQFSNLAGNLYLIECQVIDINLVESVFLIDCLNCSKQVSMDGLHYGQKQKRWCMFCNEKLIFSIGSVKFQAISSTYIAAKNTPSKKIEKKKDPLIKEGEPLPNLGTCKHYKKSHRWLRFPCCGRIYPCDICHDEKETEHEMKFASRMICGFCSKEQPYSKEKPCISCSGSLTAKSGTHWEGGKGCRNKIKMSRDDKHKYVGTCKTLSRKAQSVKTGKKN